MSYHMCICQKTWEEIWLKWWGKRRSLHYACRKPDWRPGQVHWRWSQAALPWHWMVRNCNTRGMWYWTPNCSFDAFVWVWVLHIDRKNLRVGKEACVWNMLFKVLWVLKLYKNKAFYHLFVVSSFSQMLTQSGFALSQSFFPNASTWTQSFLPGICQIPNFFFMSTWFKIGLHH